MESDTIQHLQRLASQGDQDAQQQLGRMALRMRTEDDAEDAELMRREFARFARRAWREIESRPIIWSWHLDAMCQHLQAVSEGRIRDLLICVPPRQSKSTIVSVLWPAWHWLQHPETRWLCASAQDTVVWRDAMRCHELVDTPWYQETFAPGWTWTPGQDAKGYYTTSAGGGRTSRTVGQKLIGVDADILLVDDPLDTRDAVPSRSGLRAHVEWYDESASQRLTEPTSPRVTIMQRLHEADLAGHLLERGDIDALILPAIADGEDRSISSLGWRDPRQPGDVLSPRLTREYLARKRRALGDRRYGAQYDQRPSPAEGAIFRREWIRHWDRHTIPSAWDYQVLSVDTTFREGRSNDWCCLQVWGVAGANCYLLEQVRRRMGYDQTLDEIRALHARWPGLRATVVEKAATGASVVDSLKREIPGIVGVSVQGDSKESRAEAVTPRWAAGQVYLPHPHEAPWVERLLLPELLGFPTVLHDDQVDAMTLALIWIGQNGLVMPEIYSV